MSSRHIVPGASDGNSMKTRWLHPSLLVLVGAGHLLGCGQITGIDEYAVGDASSPLPLLPARPDASRVPLCEACAAAECEAEHRACLASVACRELLECHGTCSDPACIFKCRDTRAPSFAFDDYFACVFGVSLFGVASRQLGGTDARCSGACAIGQNWECALGYYSDPLKPEMTLDFRFHDICVPSYGPLSIFAEFTVASCSSIAQPGPPAGDQKCEPWWSVNGQGQAIIDLRADHRSGILALRNAGRHAYRIYYRNAPRSGRVDVALINRSCADNTLPAVFPSYDPSRGMVAFTSHDCLGSLAVGTRIELRPTAPEVERFYWAQYGEPDPTLETGPRGGFVNVPAAQALELSAWLESEEVSRETILVADGWITSVQMFPASADQAR